MKPEDVTDEMIDAAQMVVDQATWFSDPLQVKRAALAAAINATPKVEIEAIKAECDRLRELCRAAYQELNCGDEGDLLDRSHYCVKCDNLIDRNGVLRKKLALAFVMPQEKPE